METAESWGKHLWVNFAHDDLVHVHLGLYGRFDVLRDAATVPAPVGQVRLRLVQADALDVPNATASYADLRGATACELQTREQREALVARLGPDPLRPDADPDLAWHRIRRSRAPIAGLLMDQSVVAGIGNVYRAELLFRHRVDPFRPGTSLRVGRWREMWDDLVALMADGVRTGRIDTVRPEHLTRWRSARPRSPARALLRLPPRWGAVPGLRDPGAHPRPAGAQPVLVCEVPAPIPLAGRKVSATTSRTPTMGTR